MKKIVLFYSFGLIVFISHFSSSVAAANPSTTVGINTPQQSVSGKDTLAQAKALAEYKKIEAEIQKLNAEARKNDADASKSRFELLTNSKAMCAMIAAFFVASGLAVKAIGFSPIVYINSFIHKTVAAGIKTGIQEGMETTEIIGESVGEAIGLGAVGKTVGKMYLPLVVSAPLIPYLTLLAHGTITAIPYVITGAKLLLTLIRHSNPTMASIGTMTDVI